jgi:hypothetical protein
MNGLQDIEERKLVANLRHRTSRNVKVHMDAHFSTPCENPMCGLTIYLQQGNRSGIAVKPLGREKAQNK